MLAHHPINVGAPSRHALNHDDASTPDIGRIRRVLDKARQTNRVEPGGPKPIYATEIWWDSKPPDPDGVPERKHANYLADSFYLLWKQGVRKVIWFQIRDQECTPTCGATPQTGLFLAQRQPEARRRCVPVPVRRQAHGQELRVRVGARAEWRRCCDPTQTGWRLA